MTSKHRAAPLALALTAAAALALSADPAWAQSLDLAEYQDAAKGDKILVWLNGMFTGIFGAGTASGDAPRFAPTAVMTYIGTLNGMVMAVASLMFLYNITVGVMQSAHEGEPLGRNWSSLWAPLRAAFGFTLVLPAGNGFISGQLLVGFLATLAVGGANMAWGDVAKAVFERGVPIASVHPPSGDHLVQQVAPLLACKYALDKAHRVNTKDPKAVAVRLNSGDIGGGAYRISLDGTPQSGYPAGICGSITYAVGDSGVQPGWLARWFGSASVADEALKGIRKAHRDAVHSLLQGEDSLAGLVARVVEARTPPANGALPEAPEIRGAFARYNLKLAEGVTAAMERMRAQNKSTSAAVALIKAEGWSGAGTWFLTLSTANARFLGAVYDTPTVVAPDLGQFLVRRERAGYVEASRAVTETIHWMRATMVSDPHLRGRVNEDIGIKRGEDEIAADSDGLMSKFIAKAFPKERVVSIYEGLGLNSTASAWTDPLKSMVAIGHALIGIGTVGVIALGVSTFFGSSLSFILGTFLICFYAAGAALAFVIPSMPYVIWTMAIVGWAILVSEAVVAVPLFALAHLRLDGEGLSGPTAANGWFIILNVLFRPILMIGGMLLAIGIFTGAMHLVMSTAGAMVADLAGDTGGSGGLTWAVTTLMAVGVMIALQMAIAERCFALIHALPDAVTRWVGGNGENLGEGQASDKARHVVGGMFKETDGAVSKTASARRHRGRGEGGGGGDKGGGIKGE